MMLYGFTKPVWFHTLEAAQRFAVACGWPVVVERADI